LGSFVRPDCCIRFSRPTDLRHSDAPVTVLVAKDRVTGHNPAAALYTSHSYYRRLRENSR
jgi:hypothetical protein